MKRVIVVVLAMVLSVMFSLAAFAEESDQTVISSTQTENATDNGGQNITMGGNEMTQTNDISSIGEENAESKEVTSEPSNASEVPQTNEVSSQNQI